MNYFRLMFPFIYILIMFIGVTLTQEDDDDSMSFIGLAYEAYNPCPDGFISMGREIGRKPSEENYWEGSFNLNNFTHLNEARLEITLDNSAVVTVDPNIARIESAGTTFRIIPFEVTERIEFIVKAPQNKPFPNVVGARLNGKRFCKNPTKWDPTFLGARPSASGTVTGIPTGINSFCGRRQIEHTQLVTSGQATKAGDWPWHAALYRYNPQKTSQSYQCGGTLISKTAIVTAAHCVVRRGSGDVYASELLLIILGKYNLKGRDPGSQEKTVSRVIVHPMFNITTLRNDIAMMRLETEVMYNEYVQPICLWPQENTDKDLIIGLDGIVVGWGVNEKDVLSEQITAGSMPVVSDVECILSFATFFERFVTDNTFCAGRRNGTSACNGDSGGGLVFAQKVSDNKESYFLRGIVSVSVSRGDKDVCDTNHFIVFTDSAKYLDFINEYKD